MPAEWYDAAAWNTGSGSTSWFITRQTQLSNHPISPTRAPVRLPRDIILSPLSPLPHSPRPAALTATTWYYQTPAIRPHEEDDGQLRTENLASKPMEPASSRSWFPFCFFPSNCFAPFVVPR